MEQYEIAVLPARRSYSLDMLSLLRALWPPFQRAPRQLYMQAVGHFCTSLKTQAFVFENHDALSAK